MTRSVERKPNFLVILSDQQNFRMMSNTGNPWLQTPNLDRLAASGRRFDRCYVPNPVCVPARFSFQTGRMPGSAGIYTNRDGWTLPSDEARGWMARGTLGELLREAGYETVYAGKTHFVDELTAEDYGYDRFEPGDFRRGTAEWCAAWLKEPKDKPFLLFVSPLNPHDIYRFGFNKHQREQGKEPTGEPAAHIVDALIEEVMKRGDPDHFMEEYCPPLPDNFARTQGEPEYEYRLNLNSAQRYTPQATWDEKEWRLRRWAYARLTEMMDEEVGLMLDALREAGLEENTLVIFTSDHGDMDAAHGRAEKRHNYEESVHVPFIASFPGVIAPGTVDGAHLVNNGIDLLPTLCEIAGAQPPEDLPGMSLCPLFEGRRTEWRDHVVVESEESRMICTGRYKYCAYAGGDVREMLLDLETDPGETKNVAGDPAYEDIRDRHRQRLAAWADRAGDAVAAEWLSGHEKGTA